MPEKINEIIFNVTGKRVSGPDTDFVSDLGFNSFDVVNIVGAFEDEFGITIPTRDIRQFRRVSDVLDYLEKKGVQ